MIRRWLSRFRGRTPDLDPPPKRRKPGDQDDGVGVPIPADPPPKRGGAHAKPPRTEETSAR